VEVEMGKVILNISEEYLDELISYTGKCLVGKMLKRFEIIDNKDIIKADAKELIYEEFRHLRDLIKSHNKGLNLNFFEFKTKENLT
jgi:hypothetical protein